MANSDNTFIVVLESPKATTFNALIKGKNYHFQDCKINSSLQDAVQDSEFPNFYKTDVDSQSLFCVIKISQARFFELEKIINSLDGAIESIEWPKTNEIVAFEPAAQNFEYGNIDDFDIINVESNNLFLILFSAILYSFILHDIWAGLILILLGIIKSHKNNPDNRTWIFGGGFTVLFGIICSSFFGNLAITQLGVRTGEYFEWINNLQLIDIFTKNDVLPLNQLFTYYNLNVLTFYIISVLGLGLIFQTIKYVSEIVFNANSSRLKLSTLRFFWLSSIVLFGIVSFIYFRLNIANNLFWIPVFIFVILTFLNQSGNKVKGFLFGGFGILEYVKALLKILPFGFVAILGLIYYLSTKELNDIFNNLFLRGWDFNNALVLDILAQSLLTYVFIWISFWVIKALIKIIK
jgi:hypothetical protein